MKHAVEKHGEPGRKVPRPFARLRRPSSPAVLTVGGLTLDSSQPLHGTDR
jgi:hypothetical protein